MCPETMELSAYFDGELTGAPLARIEEHLACCPACRAVLDQFALQRRLLESIDRSPSRDAGKPSRFWAYAARSRMARARRIPNISIPLPAAAAALLMFIAGTVMNLIHFSSRRFPDVVVVNPPPAAPAVVSLTVPPGAVDDLLAFLEGKQGFDGQLIHTLPAELPVARFGEPSIVRRGALEENP